MLSFEIGTIVKYLGGDDSIGDDNLKPGTEGIITDKYFEGQEGEHYRVVFDNGDFWFIVENDLRVISE